MALAVGMLCYGLAVGLAVGSAVAVCVTQIRNRENRETIRKLRQLLAEDGNLITQLNRSLVESLNRQRRENEHG